MDLLRDIRSLKELQEIDTAIFIREKACISLPEECKNIEEEVDELSKSIIEIEEKLELLLSQEKRILKTIEKDMLSLQEKKNALLLLTEQKEYSSIIKEIDVLEKANRTHEEEKLLLYEELSIQQEKYTTIQEEKENKEYDVKQKRLALEPTIAKLQSECISLQKQREDVAKHISAPMYGRYEFIRSRISYPVLALVSQGICTGCRIVLPTQIPMNLQAGQQVYTCPSCQRILYVE